MGFLEVSYYYPNFISLFDHFSIGNRDINVLSGLHLKLVHSLPGLGDVDLIAILHSVSPSFRLVSRFLRSPSITGKSGEMSVILRKRWGRMEIEADGLAFKHLEQIFFCVPILFSFTLDRSICHPVIPKTAILFLCSQKSCCKRILILMQPIAFRKCDSIIFAI